VLEQTAESFRAFDIPRAPGFRAHDPLVPEPLVQTLSVAMRDELGDCSRG